MPYGPRCAETPVHLKSRHQRIKFSSFNNFAQLFKSICDGDVEGLGHPELPVQIGELPSGAEGPVANVPGLERSYVLCELPSSGRGQCSAVYHLRSVSSGKWHSCYQAMVGNYARKDLLQVSKLHGVWGHTLIGGRSAE
jgi:hypothetical protein